MNMTERTKMLNVRVTEDEDRMLKALAEHQGMSLSDVIRQYIRRAFAEAFPPKKSKPKR
jgi:uncharacterized protein (DUF1778 family)